MKTSPTSIPDALSRHLSSQSQNNTAGLAGYVDRGSTLVTPPAVAALFRLLSALHAKIDDTVQSGLLRRRLKLLATYFTETVGGPLGAVQRDVAFALLYFLKGYDRIADHVPDVGLLDDVMVVDLVLHRHRTALRAHWLRQRRTWPEKV